MKTRNFTLAFPAVILFGVLVWLVSIHGSLKVSYDSVYYWSAARVICRDRTLSTEFPYYDTREVNFKSLYPLTAWPPGYPFALSCILCLIPSSPQGAALVISLISLILILTYAILLGKELAGAAYGIAAAVVLGVQPFFQTVLGMMWSEPLFMALTLPGLYCLIRWIRNPNGIALLVPVVLTATASTYVRYVGIVLYLVALVSTLRVCTILNRSRSGPPLVKLGSILSLYPVLMAPLLIRNIHLTGHVGGLERPIPGGIPHNLIANCIDSVRALSHLLPLAHNSWPAHTAPILSLLLLLVTVSLLYFIERKTSLGLKMQPPQPAFSSLDRTAFILLGAYSLVYTVLILTLRTRFAFNPLDIRLLFPAMVCLLILFVGGTKILLPSTSALSTGLWVFLSLLSWSITQPATRNLQPSQSPASIWFKQNPGDWASTVILSNDPIKLYLVLNQSCHWLPEVTDLPAIFAAKPYRSFLFVMDDNGLQQSTEETMRAYRAALTAYGKLIHRGDTYTIWRVSSGRVSSRQINAVGEIPADSESTNTRQMPPAR